LQGLFAEMTYKPLSPSDIRRWERYRSSAFAKILSGPFHGRYVTVVEYSDTGCRIRDHAMMCETGDVFHLMIEDVGPIVADVRWRKGSFIGTSFREKLPEHRISHLHEVLRQPLAERMERLIKA